MPSLKEYDGGAHLSEGDVSLDCVKSLKMVQVRIKLSKIDPFRKGVMLYLGRTDSELCPMAAVSVNLAVRGRASGPFFVFNGGEPLSKEIFVGEFVRLCGRLEWIVINMLVIVFELGRLPQLQQLVWRII